MHLPSLQASFFVGAGNNCFPNNHFNTYDAGLIVIRNNPPVYYQMGPYYPLRSGSFWTYRRGSGSLYSVTVLPDTAIINGVTTQALADSEGFVQYMTNDANGVQVHGQFYQPTGDSMVFVPPVRLLAAAQPIDTGVSSSGMAYTNIGDFPYTSGFRALSFESATSALRAYDTLRHSGYINLCGVTVDLTANLARGVGIVKQTQSAGAQSESIELIATNVKTAMDFDGDGKSDVSIYRDGVWSMKHSSDNTITNAGVGGPTWTPVPADYDGDGKTDTAVYLDGTWVIIRSSDGQPVVTGAGGPGFIPVPADYDGDGKADIAVYKDGVWSIMRSSDGGNTVIAHGGPGWIPVPADYDGDGKADIAVYLNGAWAIKRSSDGEITVVGHGGLTWEAVPADYDGDGKADIAVYTAGVWSVVQSSNNTIAVTGHGGPSWVPVPADYDGDGKTDVAVYNAGGAWSIKRSSDNGITVVGHGGAPQDVPLN